MFTLIKDAQVSAPAELGKKDVLLAAGLVAKVADCLDPPAGLTVEVVEAAGKILTPGLIDLHVHLIGGGGEGGPSTRVPEIQLSQITLAGVTTVLGLLGTDDVTRHPETLLAKAQGLEADGITAFILAGSYGFPPVRTVTGSLKKDIALIPQVVGVGELALSDHRSAQPTYEDLAKVAAEARVGGLIGGKPGLVHLHMGGGRTALTYLFRLVEETEIPIGQLLPTHVTRDKELFRQAIEFARMGGNIDLTAQGRRLDFRLSTAEAIRQILDGGASLERITVSSDSNGSMPVFDGQGNFKGMAVGEIGNLVKELRLLVAAGFKLSEVLPLFTANPAQRLNLQGRKGQVAEGRDADLVLFTPELEVDRVWARGRLMVSGGQALIKGFFE